MNSTDTRWLGQFATDNEWHVTPIGDLMEHEYVDCACIPRVEPIERDDGSMGWVHVHHSLDGRELSEPDYQKT